MSQKLSLSKTTQSVSKAVTGYIEVPDTGFRQHWDKLYKIRITKRLNADGLNRQQAREAASKFIEEMREIAKFKIERPGS